jgi:uncharacterized transporter YbjL
MHLFHLGRGGGLLPVLLLLFKMTWAIGRFTTYLSNTWLGFVSYLGVVLMLAFMGLGQFYDLGGGFLWVG